MKSIAILPAFMVKEEMRNGKIQLCLIDYTLPEHPLYAVYPERKFMLPKLKLFIQMLKEYLIEEK